MSSQYDNPPIPDNTPTCSVPLWNTSLSSGWQPPSCGNPPSAPLTYQEWGSHQQGNYVIAYSPKEPSNSPKVVIYLHGFSLGSPAFYQDHLYHLADRGCYVIFADYQRDAYHGSTYEPGFFSTIEDLVKSALDSLKITALQTLQNPINNALYALQQLKLSSQQPKIYIFGHSVGGFFSLSWVYGLTTATIAGSGDPPVSLSGPSSQGLTLTQFQKELLTPDAIVAASPMTGTASLPAFIQKEIDRENDEKELPPFLRDPLTIAQVGPALVNTPIAMLLGADDNFAQPSKWQESSNWGSITSIAKKMYVSRRYAKKQDLIYRRYEPLTTQSGQLFDRVGGNQLYPYHNQAVTNAIFNNAVPESLQINTIGGPGKLDAMRCNYIWQGLDWVLESTAGDRGVKDIPFAMGNWTCSEGKTVPLADVAPYPAE